MPDLPVWNHELEPWSKPFRELEAKLMHTAEAVAILAGMVDYLQTRVALLEAEPEVDNA